MPARSADLPEGWWLADEGEVRIRTFISGRMPLRDYQSLRLPREIDTDDIQALALELVERPDQRERLLAYNGSLRGPLMRLLRERKSKARPDQKSRRALRQHVTAVLTSLPPAPPEMPLALTEQRGSEPVFSRAAVGAAVASLVQSGHPRRVGTLVAALMDRYASEVRIEEEHAAIATWDAFEGKLQRADPKDSIEDDVRRKLDAEEGLRQLVTTVGDEGSRILAHVARGVSAIEIAQALSVSESTVRRRVRELSVVTKSLSVRSRQALLYALHRWLEIKDEGH